MPLPLVASVPPTPTTVTREFSSGSPGQIPVASSVIATLPAASQIFTNVLTIGGYYTTSLNLACPPLGAGVGTTVTANLTFNNSSTNNAGISAFPSTTTIPKGQVAYIQVTSFASSTPFASTAIVVSPLYVSPSPNSGWYYIGPSSVGKVGCKVSITFYNAGGAGFAGATLVATIQAILFGGAVSTSTPPKSPKLG